MALSLAKTLAEKGRTTVTRGFRQDQRTVETPHGTLTVLETHIPPAKPGV